MAYRNSNSNNLHVVIITIFEQKIGKISCKPTAQIKIPNYLRRLLTGKVIVEGKQGQKGEQRKDQEPFFYHQKTKLIMRRFHHIIQLIQFNYDIKKQNPQFVVSEVPLKKTDLSSCKTELSKIPEAKSSITIIVQQFLKQNTIPKSNARYSFACGLAKSVVKAIKLRFFHVPVQFIVPLWYFRSLTIKLAPPLLIPRFQTEYFVSLMLERILKKWPKGSSLKIADFCCGTGVIGISILKQLQNIYDIQMVFIDISQKATKYTKINCERNNISEQRYKIIKGDLLDHLPLIKQYQVILSNPPYIPAYKYKKLQKQIRLYQDKQALIAGEQGMDLVMPLAKAIETERMGRLDLIAGIQYDGQSVHHLSMQAFVVNDQYNKRRFLIFD